MRTRFGQALCGLILGSAALLAGCGEQGPEVLPVSGVVTMDGKPLEKIRVEFHPVDVGDSSMALTDAQGKFTLQTLQEQRDGAVAGSHKVVLYDTTLVQKYIPARQRENIDITEGRKSRIASRYMDKMSTPIEVQVAADIQPFTFEVEPNSDTSKRTPSTGTTPSVAIDVSDPRAVNAAEAQAGQEEADQ